MKKIISLVLPLLLLASCDNTNATNADNKSHSPDSSSQTGENTSTSEGGNESTTNTTDGDYTGQHEGDWFDEHTLLDCGYYSMGLPKNSSNPHELVTDNNTSSWWNNSLKDSLGDFRYIYKNSCDDGVSGHKCTEKFYENDAGGLKFTDKGCGFGSPMFAHSGQKLQINLTVSQVNNAKGSPETSKADSIAAIYFFNSDESLVDKVYIANTKLNSKGTFTVYYTVDAPSVSYFEFRLRANPYKSSQCYNVGMSECNIKAWPQI